MPAPAAVSRPRALELLRGAPAVIPCAAALGIVGWWAFAQGGFQVSKWAPGGLLLLGVLAACLVGVPNRWGQVPRAVLVAAGCLAAYCAWSYLSIAWAADPGYALEGAARTSLYLIAFVLFASWPQREWSAAVLLGAWVATVTLVAVVTAVRLLGSSEPARLFAASRLRAPTGYPNATAALLLMPLLGAVGLSAARGLPSAVRGAAAAAGVVLGAVALLTVSRGAVYGLPVVVVLAVVLVPGRARTILALVPVAAGIGVCAPRLLAVGDALAAGQDPSHALHRALTLVAVAALVAGLVAGVAAEVGRRRPADDATAQRRRRTVDVALCVVIAVCLLGGAVAGHPVARARSGWSSFKGGYAENTPDRNRLVSGLGSNRYDFYRVAWGSFRDHPVAGIGADNFYQQYLRAGRSAETPRYPHSWELRALSQTGVVGGLLLLAFLASAGLAALRGMRSGGPIATAAAGGAAMACVYWLVHGSLDWFWEWPGLGVPAMAMLGLAASLAPRRPVPVTRPARSARRSRAAVVAAASVAVAVAAAVPLLGLWASDHEVRAAAASFAQRPLAAYAHLDRAAALDPGSSTPRTVEGSIALRFTDLARADAAFSQALDRVPDDQYATLELGSVASARGQHGRALRLLERAAALAPRDPLTREALGIVRSGGRVDVGELNRRILLQARQLAG